MRTVTYKSVQDKAMALLAGSTSAGTGDVAALNVFINARYREAFESYFWPEWTVVERRYFRPPYSGTTNYALTNEVFYWPTLAYYQAVRAPLLTVSSLTRAGATATATTSGSHALATGNRVTISGVTPSGYNGTWTITVTGDTTFTYAMAADPGASGSGTMRAGVNPASASEQVTAAYWAESLNSYSGDDWAATTAYAAGTTVYQPFDGNYYVCHTAHANQQPPNTAYWGLLTPFQRDIDYTGSATSNQGETATSIGEVKKVWDRHPYVEEGAVPVRFDVTSDGLVVRGVLSVHWVEFRRRPNDFTGSNWVSTGSYAVGTQVYYSTTGEYYVCIQAATTDLPTDTAYWTKLDFPYVLRDAVAHSAYADLLKEAGKTSKWGVEIAEARRLLAREYDKLERQQGQTSSLNVMLR